MKVTRVIARVVIAASVSVSTLHAQTLRSGQTPAEFPPASFAGSQYVDSAGCVYIRAGIDGNVTWVPRVNRQRDLVCGQRPTLSASATRTARSAPSQSTRNSAVEQISLPTPAPKATSAAVKAAATVRAPVAKPAPAPTRRIVAKPTPRPTAPVVVPRARPAPVAVATTAAPAAKTVQARNRVAQRAQPACQGASAVSSRYINSGARLPVRCGPQRVARSANSGVAVRSAATTAPVATRTARASVQTAPASRDIRVVPRHVYNESQRGGPKRVPEGFAPVWDDDRLNPRRAEQSLEGIARSQLIWSNTVPRRLLDKQSGQDVTTSVPLVYPYTDEAVQRRELGTVTLMRRNGKLVKRIVRNKARTPAPTTQRKVAAVPATKNLVRAAPKATAVAKPKVQAAPRGRYVQVGTYGVSANATAAARRITRAGLPARVGKLTRGGKTYQVVLAGPFASSGDLSRGLQRSRAAGFGDAFVR